MKPTALVIAKVRLRNRLSGKIGSCARALGRNEGDCAGDPEQR